MALAVYEEGLNQGAIIESDNVTLVYPDEGNGIGIIFYPGAKVEAIMEFLNVS